jgi:hypothetical protein
MRFSQLLLVVPLLLGSSAVRAAHATESKAPLDVPAVTAAVPLPLSLSPDVPFVGSPVVPEPIYEPPHQDKDEQFEFHGYFRIPLRLGLNTTADPDRLQIHSPAWVPDATSRREGVPDDYRLWQYTHQAPAPWTQLNFSYGNAQVRGTLIIASHTVSDGAYNNLSANLGINQAFVTVNLPSAFSGRLKAGWNVGAFSDRYGAMGPDNAGKYETYLFGRTHVAGETFRASYALDNFHIRFEHGVGGKIDRVNDTSRIIANPDLILEGQVGSTLLHHAHLGLGFRDNVMLGLHYMRSWVQERPARADFPQPSMTIAGADLRLRLHRFGEGYVGYAINKADNVLYLGNAIEPPHSPSALVFAENYLGAQVGGMEGIRSGTIHNVAWQHTASLRRLVGPQRLPDGQWDVFASVFGLYNQIEGRNSAEGLSYKKLKWGADLAYLPLPWLAGAIRYDHVNPVVGDEARSFTVMSGRLVLRTKFFSHEQIVIGYSRYAYGDNVVGPPLSNEGPVRSQQLDTRLVYLAAVLWW